MLHVHNASPLFSFRGPVRIPCDTPDDAGSVAEWTVKSTSGKHLAQVARPGLLDVLVDGLEPCSGLAISEDLHAGPPTGEPGKRVFPMPFLAMRTEAAPGLTRAGMFDELRGHGWFQALLVEWQLLVPIHGPRIVQWQVLVTPRQDIADLLTVLRTALVLDGFEQADWLVVRAFPEHYSSVLAPAGSAIPIGGRWTFAGTAAYKDDQEALATAAACAHGISAWSDGLKWPIVLQMAETNVDAAAMVRIEYSRAREAGPLDDFVQPITRRSSNSGGGWLDQGLLPLGLHQNPRAVGVDLLLEYWGRRWSLRPCHYTEPDATGRPMDARRHPDLVCSNGQPDLRSTLDTLGRVGPFPDTIVTQMNSGPDTGHYWVWHLALLVRLRSPWWAIRELTDYAMQWLADEGVTDPRFPHFSATIGTREITCRYLGAVALVWGLELVDRDLAELIRTRLLERWQLCELPWLRRQPTIGMSETSVLAETRATRPGQTEIDIRVCPRFVLLYQQSGCAFALQAAADALFLGCQEHEELSTWACMLARGVLEIGYDLADTDWPTVGLDENNQPVRDEHGRVRYEQGVTAHRIEPDGFRDYWHPAALSVIERSPFATLDEKNTATRRLQINRAQQAREGVPSRWTAAPGPTVSD